MRTKYQMLKNGITKICNRIWFLFDLYWVVSVKLCVSSHYSCTMFPYSADSLRWADLDTFHGTWPHIQCSACLGERFPTEAPHTRSSTWVWWLSTPQSCAGWCRRWGISRLGASSYRRDFSTKIHRDWFTFLLYYRLTLLDDVREDWPVPRCAGCWMSELTWCLPSWSFGLKTVWQEKRGYFISYIRMLGNQTLNSSKVNDLLKCTNSHFCK